ncbi:MAG: hypothetical protein Q9222_004637 [Ikaeria aurantiellina]
MSSVTSDNEKITESPPSEKSTSPHGKSEDSELPKSNGGFVAWLQVLGAFCLSFTTWGIVNAFGAYQSYYQENLLSTSSAFQISWIGSVQACLLLVIGVLTGPLFDRGYLNELLLVGSFLTVLGIMMTSLSTNYWQVLLAQGICVGLGAGCLFVPSIAVVSSHFTSTTTRAVATGLAVGGSSIGGIIYPIAFRGLQPALGFEWATRIIGFITLAVDLTALVTMWTKSPSRQPRALFQPAAFKSWAYTFHCIGFASGFIGLYVPMFYIQVYALARSNVATDYAFYLLSVLNAGSFIGRVVPGFLVGVTGPMNMLVLCAFASAILCFCWIKIESVAGLTIFAILYGFFAGAYVSLAPPVLVSLTPDMSVVGTWMGMSLFVASFGLLVGTPIAGSLVHLETNDFVAAQGFAGGVIMLGAILMLLALLFQARRVRSWKV